MALRNQPYLPLYVQDFLTDEKLNQCSASSQGIYIKIMCILHKQEEYGTILLKQKDKQNASTCQNFAYKFVKLLPFNTEELLAAITELVEEGVLTIDGDKMFQKRMVQDNRISEVRSKAGKKGGFAKAKDLANNLAKSKQNPEYENEYEYVNEFEIKKDIYKEKANFNFSFLDVEVFDKRIDEPFFEWINYLQNVKGIDFNQSIIEQHYINIRNLSKCKYDKAVELIYTAIRKTWKDVYITNDEDSILPIDLKNIHKNSENESYVKFIEWVEKYYPRLNRMREPFTEEQFNALFPKYTRKQLEPFFTQINNSVYLYSKKFSPFSTILEEIQKQQNPK